MGWLKASLLEQGMTLLDKHGLPNVTIISQTKLDHTETVYNFEVDDFHTYHIGELGIWVHNAKCCDLAEKTSVTETKRGVISNKKLNNNAIELDLTPTTTKQAKEIAKNGDPSGTKTEALFENVVKEHGGEVMSGGKYGSNNGYDHVVVFKDTDGQTYLTMTVDSKQLGKKGVTLDPKAAGGAMQMSKEWDDAVLNKLDRNSDAYKAVETARKNGSLVKGVAYVDKSTGELKLVRINPTTRTK
ncbi:polymorphic toxin-type HINT domain-containing protein [Moraxella catarrhalis]